MTPPLLVEPDDATLVARAAAGDEQAFAALYQRHCEHVARVAYRIFGDELEVDDVVQETFIDAAGALRSVREPERVRAWLISIAVRRVHRRLRRRRRRQWLGRTLGLFGPARSDPREVDDVGALYQALERLAPELRVPWSLHVLEGQTLPDVAVACGVSLATIKRRIAAAAAELEQVLHAP